MSLFFPLEQIESRRTSLPLFVSRRHPERSEGPPHSDSLPRGHAPASRANFHSCLLVLASVALLLTLGCRKNSFPDYPPGYREFAYIANSASNTVSVLDLVYLRTDRTLSVGDKPVALAASPTRDEVYVLSARPAQFYGTLAIIDTKSNAIAASIPLERNPQSLSIDHDGERAYVANAGSNSITVLDLAHRRAIATVPTPGVPGSILISPDARTLVVTLPATGSVALFSATEPTPARRTALHPLASDVVSSGPALNLRTTFSGCPGATSPVILPDSSRTFVACPGSNQVLSIGLAQTASTWGAKQDASLMQDRRLALLDTGRGPQNLTIKPDGGEIFVSDTASDSVSEIATETDEVGSTYPIGNRPTHGIVSADNSALWIADSGASSLSLYSISDGKLVSSIRTGNSPSSLAFSADEHLLLAADQASGDVAVIRTTSRLGPALFTLLPAGNEPSAIAIKAMQPGK